VLQVITQKEATWKSVMHVED